MPKAKTDEKTPSTSSESESESRDQMNSVKKRKLNDSPIAKEKRKIACLPQSPHSESKKDVTSPHSESKKDLLDEDWELPDLQHVPKCEARSTSPTTSKSACGSGLPSESLNDIVDEEVEKFF